MRVRLQELTPFQDCLRWQIQADYYRTRGRQAFSSNEVPAYITSNYFAARQKARLLLAALDAQAEEVKVLECGGGSGWFAYNFIRAFGDLCEAGGRKLRLRYLLTDAADSGLRDLALQPRFAGWFASGRLSLGLLNLSRPEQATGLDGSPAGLMPGSQDLILCNYSFCTLPVALLRKQQGTWHQRHVRLFYPQLTPGPYDQRLIEEEESFLPLPADYALRALLESLCQELEQACFPVAAGALAALEGLLPLLRPGGLLLISDKAITETWQMDSAATSRCSFHGQSLAHYVNFPLLAKYAEGLGVSVLHTHAPTDELQTLMIAPRSAMPAGLAESFRAIYTEFNQNHVLGSLKSACQALYEQGHIEAAARHYAKVLLHDPQHAESLYVVARHMLAQKAWDWALRALETPTDDCLDLFDFDRLRALALEGLNRHRDAIEAHRLSLRRAPEAEVWFGLGRCHLALREPEQARAAFEQALGLQPDHAPALEALRGL